MTGTTPEQRWLALHTPAAQRPAGRYLTSRLHGDTLLLSGHGPTDSNGPVITGTVGVDLDLEQARAAARLTALNTLATARAALGSLDRITAVLDVLGFVACSDDFHQQPQVLDAFGETYLDILGDDVGAHARAAVGVAALPFGIPVEVTVRFAVA